MSYIPHSTFSDETRLIAKIKKLIKDGELESCKAWEASIKDEKARHVRQKQGEAEAAEAETLAKELGVWDEFYGSGKTGTRKAKGKNKTSTVDDEDTAVLQALILKKKNKMEGFFDNLAAKYGQQESSSKSKRGKKRSNEEDSGTTGKKSKQSAPPDIDDEEFEKLQKKLFGDKKEAGQSQGSRKTAKAKTSKGRKA